MGAVCCRDDDDESPDRVGKVVPEWAQSHNLMRQLQEQRPQDPDKIFGAKQTSCDLDVLFDGVGEWQLGGITVALCTCVGPLSIVTLPDTIAAP